MSGTLAIVTVWRGHESMSAGYDLAEAEEWRGVLVTELGARGWDGPPEIRDLLPDLEERFQPGTDVWLGKRVYWRKGQHGTVAAGEPESHAKWFPSNPSPWFISQDGASVWVVLDDGYASWWPARWLDTR